MKIASMFTAFNLKALLIVSSLSIGFSNLNMCSAQSLVTGKWKMVSNKQFYTPEGEKQTGKAVIEGKAPAGSEYQCEFKADHTYLIEGKVGGKNDNSSGQWSVAGNQLTMKAAAEVRTGGKGRVYTFVITGNTMIKTLITQPPYNDIVFKQEDTSIRM